MIKKTVLFILTVGCMAAIFLFSAQKASVSNKTSEGFIESVVRFFDFDKTLSDSEISEIAESAAHCVRKAAHFSIFAVLGFFTLLLLLQFDFSVKRSAVITVIWAFIYACSDEIHQCFVPGRSAQVSDVLIDTAGAFCGMAAALLVYTVLKKIILKQKGRKTHGL